MKQMTPAAVERAMKLQDVMLRAMAKRITWYQAAEILGLSGRQMLRWQTRFKHEGYEGLFDRRRGTPSPKRVPLETVETVLRLYQEQYFDFNVRHFHEKLGSEHGIKLSYTWVKAALQGAGLVKARKHRGKHRKRRPRRPLPGMLLHIAPIFEVRSGFPYSVPDAEQNFVGLRNSDQTRFPTFLSLDAEIAKEFQLTRKYGVRLSLRVFNATNHFNPRDVRANTADLHFGEFFASYHRFFSGGFDIVF
ncbi:MAG: hypothetical protein QOG23_4433 [Blastocatellia bacterium]|jgi:transposase|nr:hypothetical protein [Blastocatellia bacterium]